MKREIYAIVLLLILTVPGTGCFSWLQVRRMLVREEVRERIAEGMEEEQHVLLKFTVEESESLLKWRDDREFEYRGEMYDISERTIIGDTLYFICWHDKEETELNRDLASLSCTVLPGDLPLQKEQIRPTGFLQFTFLAGQLFGTPEMYQETRGLRGIPAIHYPSVYITPPDPPPRTGLT